MCQKNEMAERPGKLKRLKMSEKIEKSERTDKEIMESDKSRAIALLLCFFLGFLGAHRFYEGKFLTGMLYLCTLGLLGIGEVVDFFNILGGRAKDAKKQLIVNW